MSLRDAFIARSSEWSSPAIWLAAAAQAVTLPLIGRIGRRRRKGPVLQADLVAEVEQTGLFDAAWYAKRYPDVVGEGQDPIVHFSVHGWREGRWPNPLFHADLYLAAHPELLIKGVNPLVHYVREGAAAGASPNPLFDPDWYAARHLGGARAGALFHFLESGDTEPGPDFDAAWYRARYLGGEVGINALAHYYASGRERGYLRNPQEHAVLSARADVIRRSGIFDPEFYSRRCTEVAASGLDPLEHYVMAGGYRRYPPHPLFDLDWYVDQAQEVLHRDLNPLLHFIETGAAAGLDPSPFFDTRWYRATHLKDEPDANPLGHFLADGGRTTSPSPRFDAPWYLGRNPRLAALGINPLVHHIATGLDAGVPARPIAGAGHAPVTDAALACVKRGAHRWNRTALFITHAPDGRVRGHVEPYLRAFVDNGIDVVLIVAADQRRTSVPDVLLDLCAAVYARANVGFDFSAWAHVLQEDGDLLGAETLYLVNDSLVGPLDRDDFRAILAKIDAYPEDIVGLADNYYYSQHVQSFFLALKKRCLSSYAFNLYLQSIVSWPTKNAVITEYEMTFSARMRVAGIATRALFSTQNRHTVLVNNQRNNRVVFDWENMLGQGFPFVKRSLLGEHASLGGEAVREAVETRGFDLARLDQTYAYPGGHVRVDLERPAPAPGRATRVAFLAPTNFASGLGVAARSYLRALHRAPWSVSVHPMERPFNVHGRVAPDWQAPDFSGPPDVALVHFNGDSWHSLMSPRQRDLAGRARRKVGLFVWETSYVPAGWLPTVDGLDAIWAPTEFCASIFRTITDAPVDVVPYVVENEAGEPASAAAKARLRTAFGVDPGKRLILYAFDGSSYLVRKNPHALIRAFRAAGLARAGWQLVLKTKHVFELPEEGQRLYDLVGQAGDVVVIDQPIAQGELTALFEACDVYASSHSSEGFGLTIAEAMEMGKVVVATDYGGSRDFLDATCGFPVKAEITALAKTYGPYLRGAEWGQVDEDDLARALKDAARAVEGGDAARIGAAARARIRERLSTEAVAAAMRASLDRLTGSARG